MLLELCRGAELDIGGCIEDREEKPLDLLDRKQYQLYFRVLYKKTTG